MALDSSSRPPVRAAVAEPEGRKSGIIKRILQNPDIAGIMGKKPNIGGFPAFPVPSTTLE